MSALVAPVRRAGQTRAERWRGAAVAPARGAFASPPRSAHPLADAAINAALRRRASEIEAAFAAIEPALRDLAPQQFSPDFVERARAELTSRLGFAPPAGLLEATWLAPLDARRLHAACVLATFRRLVARAFDRGLADLDDGEDADSAIRRFGFHAIDITPCSDGRLSGVVDYILRVPPSIVTSRRSRAGADFDVEEALRRWEGVELRRWREGRPTAPAASTRFLKIAVYHYSSAAPATQGCAAHGSDAGRAAEASLARLEQFASAVRGTYGRDAAVAVLAIGVDTDTDAIRVHVPNASGAASAARFVDNTVLYEATRELSRDAAKDAIREAVASVAGVAADDAATEGMRWFCGYVLKKNLGQMDAVRARYGGRYPDAGHSEHLAVVGDAIDDVQLRNLAFAAQLDTVEEGAADLDIGMRILAGLAGARGLAVPVLVHARFDPNIPGSEDRARVRARRLHAAIAARYAALGGGLYVESVVRAGDGTVLTVLDPPVMETRS